MTHMSKFFTKRALTTVIFLSGTTLFLSSLAWQPVLNKDKPEPPKDPILEIRLQQAQNDKLEIEANKKKAEAEAAVKAAIDANKNAEENILKLKQGDPVSNQNNTEPPISDNSNLHPKA